MGRIPDKDVERIKRDVSIVALAQAAKVELIGSGDNLKGRCPFHDDDEPSLVVSPSKNLWHCLGACDEGGDVIAWVCRERGVSFRHAVELLRSGSLAPVEQSKGTGKFTRMLTPLVERDTEDGEVLRQVVGFYHDTLKQSPDALAYLETRGLVAPDMVDHFKLGFGNRTLGYRLPPPTCAAGDKARAQLKRVGVLSAKGYELFTGSLTVPILGATGDVLGMYGRKIAPATQMSKDTPRHLYLPGPHRGVFNEEALGESVILCEALIDALTFWCAGLRNVTASYGVHGFTADHLAAFKRHDVKQVYLAYDRDDAGEAAAVELAETLMRERVECFRVQFPRGTDANEHARKNGFESLRELVRHATWLGKGVASPAIVETPVVADVEPLPVLAAEPPAPAAGEIEPPPAITVTPAPPPPAPAARKPVPEVELLGEEVKLTFGERRYRVRGLGKNLAYDQLRVNLLAARGDSFHVDTLDLYAAKQRVAFVKLAALELKLDEQVMKGDLTLVLRKLEELQHELIEKANTKERTEVVLSEADRAAAMELLTDPQLLDRILADYAACGIVGEEDNKLMAYLGVVSCLLEEPLAIVVQSSSAAGKTVVMEGTLAFVPAERRVKFSAMTGQALFYMGETDLSHKVLAIVEEAGAQKASYALKLLQSEGELTIASTGKDPQSGRLVTQEYVVKGPVMLFLTTTAIEIDEELMNRCLVLTVNEDREQTRAIHRRQREKQTLAGLLARQAQPAVLKVHQDAQRLLRPLLVANPYARHLTFVDDRTRTRRDHMKYLTLIRVIALLHQYQREVHLVEHRGQMVPYIEVSLADIAVANRLAHQVLGRSLDELAPQTRRLLMLLNELVGEAAAREHVDRSTYRFRRREVRERTGWGNTQLKVHLSRLEEMEYVHAHRGPGGHEYELLYDGSGKDGTPFLTGLLDVDKLTDRDRERSGLEGDRSALEGVRSAPGRPPVGGWSGGGRTADLAVSTGISATELHAHAASNGNSHLGSVSLDTVTVPITVPVTGA